MEQSAPNDNDLDLQFSQYRYEVWVTKGGDHLRLGPIDQVCEEMARFLAEVDFGERG